MLSEKDLKQLEEKGIGKTDFLNQIAHFKNGFPSLILDRPATPDDGIARMDESRSNALIAYYDKEISSLRPMQFIPASGAATRMFKDLFQWKELIRAGVDVKALLNAHPGAREFFERLRDFAFWEALSLELFRDDLDADHLLEQRNYLPLIDYLLFDPGLEYAWLPKALLHFHRYQQTIRTSMEEHMVEGVHYARDGGGVVHMHFTLSPDHLDRFRRHARNMAHQYEPLFKVKYSFQYSVQKPSTDTIAVDEHNLPFREKSGSLLFRPGGHGALIENLNDLDADLAFIKNIDNVVPDRLKHEGIRSRKVLGGLLLELKEGVQSILKKADKGLFSAADYKSAVDFATQELMMDKSQFPADATKGSKVLKTLLNRPIRVCGMVKNQGEPGGGPYWVKDPKTGKKSLQIVEMSQIDVDNPQQAAMVGKATHFNPVDMVCLLKDYQGGAFDLKRFVDADTGFISSKTKDGKPLKALEKPGLWNGAMAGWITVFVEIPLIAFNPVKTVNVLLRDTHQPG